MFVRSRFRSQFRYLIAGFIVYFVMISTFAGSDMYLKIMEQKMVSSYVEDVSMDIVVQFQEEFKSQNVYTETSVLSNISMIDNIQSAELIDRILLSSTVSDWDPLTVFGVRNSFLSTFESWFSYSMTFPLSNYSCIVENQVLSDLGLVVGNHINLSLIDTSTGTFPKSKSFLVVGTFDSTFGEIEQSLNPEEDWYIPDVITASDSIREGYEDLFYGESNGVNPEIILRYNREALSEAFPSEIEADIEFLIHSLDQTYLPYVFVSSSGLLDSFHSLSNFNLFADRIFKTFLIPVNLASFILVLSFVSITWERISNISILSGRGASNKQMVIWLFSFYACCAFLAALLAFITNIMILYFTANLSIQACSLVLLNNLLPSTFASLALGLSFTIPWVIWAIQGKVDRIEITSNIDRILKATIVIVCLLLVNGYLQIAYLANIVNLTQYRTTISFADVFFWTLLTFLVSASVLGGGIIYKLDCMIWNRFSTKRQKAVPRILAKTKPARPAHTIASVVFLAFLVISTIYIQTSVYTADKHIDDVVSFYVGSDVRIDGISNATKVATLTSSLKNIDGIESIAFVARRPASLMIDNEFIPITLFGITDAWWNTVLLRDDFFAGYNRSKAEEKFLDSPNACMTNYGEVEGYQNGYPLFDNDISLISNQSEPISLTVVDRITHLFTYPDTNTKSYLPGYPNLSGYAAIVHLETLANLSEANVFGDLFIRLDPDSNVESLIDAIDVTIGESYTSISIYNRGSNSFLGRTSDLFRQIGFISNISILVISILGILILEALWIRESEREISIMLILGCEHGEVTKWFVTSLVAISLLGLCFGFLLSQFLVSNVGTLPIQAFNFVSEQPWDLIPEKVVVPSGVPIILCFIFSVWVLLSIGLIRRSLSSNTRNLTLNPD